jgi:hypothetical protein
MTLASAIAPATVAGVPGANRLKLAGKLLRRRPGVYPLTARPSTHTRTGAARSARLRIRRRR